MDIRVALPDRTVHREKRLAKASTKIGAEQEAKDREAYLIRNGADQPEESEGEEEQKTLFKDFYADFYSKKKLDDLSPSYLDWMKWSYDSRLAEAFDDKFMNDITTEVINDFRRQLRNPEEGQGLKVMGKKAANNLLGYLGLIFKSAVEQGKMKEMPKIARFKIPKEKLEIDGIECLSEQDLELLVEGSTEVNPDIHLAVLLGADAGLRLGEILGVKPSTDMKSKKDPFTSEVTWELLVSRSIYHSKKVVHVKPPKNGKPRTIPLTPRLKEALSLRVSKPGYALQDEQGAALIPKTVTTWLREAQKKAGLEVTGRMHVLRHTFCSRLAMKGVPLKAIQALADHANISTTEKYLHSDLEIERRAINALTPVPKPQAPTPIGSGAPVEQPKLKIVSA